MGAYFSTAPFVGAGLALAIGSEPLSLRLLLAGTLMGIGVWLHLSEVHDHAHVHEAMAHGHLHWHDAHHQHAHAPEDPLEEPHNPDIHHLHPHP